MAEGAAGRFVVGLTRDFLAPDGTLAYRDIGLDLLDAEPGIERRFLETSPAVMRPEDLRGLDAVISLGPRYAPSSLAGAERLLAIVRFGVGYDLVDVPACTAADVAVVITAGAVNRSMAEAILAWMLALGHRVVEKDRLVREGRWGEKAAFMGGELRDRTLGIVGLGGIGRTLAEMVRGLGMKRTLAHDPYAPPEQAAAAGVDLVPLERLLRESDYVSINCPLNDETRGLIGRDRLALMKPGAFLINTARGGIVDEAALAEALRSGRLAGAAVDVFESEPADGRHPLAGIGTTILAPHAIGWTHELFRDIGRAACLAARALARGEVPPGVVNREVLDRGGFRKKFARRGT